MKEFRTRQEALDHITQMLEQNRALIFDAIRILREMNITETAKESIADLESIAAQLNEKENENHV